MTAGLRATVPVLALLFTSMLALGPSLSAGFLSVPAPVSRGASSSTSTTTWARALVNRRHHGSSTTSRWAYYMNDTIGSGGGGGEWPSMSRVPAVRDNGGRVTLVGAGPGDPDLLTLAAVRALSTADLVIADRLIPTEILDLVQGELRIARKHPGCAEQAQQEIYAWVKEGVDQGRHVVRLKIGDPFLFGRGGEEVHEYRACCGVEPRLVPGVSSAFSAPLLSAIPVTHRGVANQVYICTGYGRDGDRPYLAPYYPNQTAVFLMAMGRLAELSANLQQVGYPPATPVAIVERASTPRQRTLLGTVATIADVAAREQAAAPAVIVVGEVVHVLLDRDGPAVLEAAALAAGTGGGGGDGNGNGNGNGNGEAMRHFVHGTPTEKEMALLAGTSKGDDGRPAFFLRAAEKAAVAREATRLGSKRGGAAAAAAVEEEGPGAGREGRERGQAASSPPSTLRGFRGRVASVWRAIVAGATRGRE